jgi:type II secretory pathway component PulK
MKAERGFVLISVMLAMTLLAVVATEFAFSMRLEASMVRSYRDSVLAAHLAEGGVQQAIREVLSGAQIAALDEDGQLVFYRALPGQTTPERLPRLPRTRVPLGPGAFSYRITDEAARLDINASTPARLGRLLDALDVEPRQRDIINDSLQDWRDRDEVHRLNGAESEDVYLRLPLPYRSRNGNLQDASELRQIRGVSQELYVGTGDRPGLGDLVTAVAVGRVNLNTASAPVLKALGFADAEVADVLQTRVRVPYLTVPARFGGRGLVVGSATFRIEAEGRIPGSPPSRVLAIVQRGGRTGAVGVTFRLWRPETEG